MKTNRRRAFGVLAAMGATAALAQAGKPTVHLADVHGKPDLPTLFPPAFADWRIDTSLPVILPAPDVQARLDAIYNQTLSRTYVNGSGARIMLSVAYGGDQSDGTRAHRPEVCYPVQGFQITHNREDTLRLADRQLPVRRLMSRLQQRFEPITYWLVVGGRAVTSGAQQKVIELRHGLRGQIPDGMLIRVSNIDHEMRRGHALHDSYLQALFGALQPAARSRIFGDSANV